MKRLISLAAMLLIAAFTMGASAQNILGQWKVDTEKLLAGEDIGDAELEILFSFEDDNTGLCDIYVNMSQPMDNTTDMRFELLIYMEYEWELDGNNLTLSPTDVDLSLGEISFSPANPQYDALVPYMRQAIEQQFGANKEAVISQMGISSGESTVEFPENDVLVMQSEDDAVITMYRM